MIIKKPDDDIQIMLQFLDIFDPPAVRSGETVQPPSMALSGRSPNVNSPRNPFNRAGAATREVCGVEQFHARSTKTYRNPSTAGRDPEQPEHGTTSLSRSAAVVLSNPPQSRRPAPESANGHPTP